MTGFIRLAATSAALALCITAAHGEDAATQAGGAAAACVALENFAIPAAEIGLPTGGADVSSAALVAAAGEGSALVPEHCLVTGAIHPVDAAAPDILFKLALPTEWNSSILMFGGGGFDGSVPNVVGNVATGPTDQPLPLARGYAVFGSDSGHQANDFGSQDGSFALNQEAARNFGGDALKKTRDAAAFVVKAHYGVNDIAHAYFAGGSTGGREALAAITRWPEDWDGAIALYPAWNDAAALLDGVEDGLIGNQVLCNATFDPRSVSLNGKPVMCGGDKAAGDVCLTDAQITALETINTDAKFDFPLASGETQYPGYNVWGSDLGITTNPAKIQPIVTFLAFGTSQPEMPMPRSAPYISVLLDQWIKHSVTRDPEFDSLSFDPENPGAWAARISELSTLLDTRVDLEDFAAHGGKLLLMHGQSDVLVSTRATQQYYLRLQARMTPAEVDNFVRYYEVPGYGHALSSVFNAAWDSLTTLENWVEKGIAPKDQIVTDTVGVPGRTRPLCTYPQWPQYKGDGDVNAASSFVCVH